MSGTTWTIAQLLVFVEKTSAFSFVLACCLSQRISELDLGAVYSQWRCVLCCWLQLFIVHVDFDKQSFNWWFWLKQLKQSPTVFALRCLSSGTRFWVSQPENLMRAVLQRTKKFLGWLPIHCSRFLDFWTKCTWLVAACSTLCFSCCLYASAIVEANH